MRSSTRSSTTSASTRRRRGCSSRRPMIETVADFLATTRVPLVVDPVMVASSGARLLRGRRGRDAGRAALPARDGGHAEPAGGAGARRRQGDAARARRADPRARRAGGGRHRRPRRRRRRPPLRRPRARRDPGRAARRRRDARRRLHAFGDACGAARAGAARSRRPRAGRRAAAARAVAHGLVEIGAGDGPVDVLGICGSLTSASSACSRSSQRRGLATRIEDDAAQLADGRVVTQDALVEGVHFRLDWISWRDLGFRAAAVNLSDLAASGAEPGRARRHAGGARRDTAVDDVLELYAGPRRGRRAGDRRRHVGRRPARPQRDRARPLGARSRPGGARPGDVLVVTGPLGAAGAAFRERALRRGRRSGSARGAELARSAHAMLDISDGLAVDARHIADRSGCRVVIDLERVPLADGATLDDLGFGEDYELLAAVAEPQPASPRSAAARRARASSSCSTAAAGSTSAASSTSHPSVGTRHLCPGAPQP